MVATLEDILLASFVAVEGAHAFSAFNPSIFTIRTFKDDEKTKKSIREGYVLATVFAFVLAGIVSLIARSPLPVIFAVFTVAFMIAVYEYALRS